MNPTIKKILAREFLILIAVIGITTLSWLTIYLVTKSTNDRYKSLISSLSSMRKKFENLEYRNNPNPKFIEYFLAPSNEIVITKDKGPWVEVLDRFKRFNSNPNVSKNLTAFTQARQNLIEIHKTIIDSEDEEFYDTNRDFNDFLLNLNKNLLLKIHNGITGQTHDFRKIAYIPNRFNDFLINIGFDTLTYTPIINIQLSDHEKAVEDCKQNITKIESEINEIKSSFLYFDINIVTYLILIILLGLAYPIRGLIKMTLWAVKTLRTEKE